MLPKVGDAVRTKGQLRKYGLLTILAAFSIGSALYAGKAAGRPAQVQPAAQAAQGAPEVTPYADLQRPYRIDHYTEVAENGPARGENIYYHKCWVCHNQYQEEAPHLTDFFKKTPFDETFVTTQIKDGSAGMPSFRTSLSDAAGRQDHRQPGHELRHNGALGLVEGGAVKPEELAARPERGPVHRDRQGVVPGDPAGRKA
jgi:cytochrome c5